MDNAEHLNECIACGSRWAGEGWQNICDRCLGLIERSMERAHPTDVMACRVVGEGVRRDRETQSPKV